MVEQIFKLTQKQYDDLVERKKYLIEVAMPENSLEIEKAKEFGDLKENAEYHSAKDLQGKLNSELNQINTKLNRSTIIKKGEKSDRVEIGSQVKVLFENEKETMIFTLIGENGNGEDEIDVESKLGKSIYQKRVGEKFSFEANDTSLGELYFQVLEIL